MSFPHVDLPGSWEAVAIGDLCHLINGRAFKPTEWSVRGLPIIRIQNLNNPQAAFNHYDGDYDARHLVASGDLLFAWSGTPGTSFGAHIWNGDQSLLNQHIFRILIPEDLLSKDYFRWAINHKLEELISKAHGGVGLRHVTKGNFETTEVPLPPLAEQRRIVSRIDALQARSRKARESLAEIGPLLSQFRQSLLSAAFRGDLTADWRAANPNTEPATELLARIRQDRRRKWEEAELAKYEAAAKKPPKGWQRRYMGPQIVDPRGLPEVPRSWIWATADDVCSQITDGEHVQPKYQSSGFPMLTAKHVRDGHVTFDDAGMIAEGDFKKCLARCAPMENDILIVSVGATTGRTAIVGECQPFAIVRSVLLLKPLLHPRFLLAWTKSSWCVDWMTSASGATAQAHLYITATKKMPIPLPPLAEQIEIARQVDDVLSTIDQLSATVSSLESALAVLDQSILAKAFRGDLVPQDPRDEPASVLLERIRKTRTEGPPSRAKRGATGKRKPASHSSVPEE